MDRSFTAGTCMTLGRDSRMYKFCLPAKAEGLASYVLDGNHLTPSRQKMPPRVKSSLACAICGEARILWTILRATELGSRNALSELRG
jgi:hypothetical protein